MGTGVLPSVSLCVYSCVLCYTCVHPKMLTCLRAREQELKETRDTLNRAHTAFSKGLATGGLDAKFSAPRFGLFTQLYLSEAQVV